MTVRRSDRGMFVLDGICPVDDAEPLLQMLQTMPAASDDTATHGLSPDPPTNPR